MTAGNDKRPVAAAVSELRALSGSGSGQRLQRRRKEQRQQRRVIMCFVLIKPIIDDVCYDKMYGDTRILLVFMALCSARLAVN